MKKTAVISILVLCAASITFWYLSNRIQSPEFVKIANIQLSDFENNVATCHADVVLLNPNKFKAKLIYTDISVFSNDLKVANISQTSVSEIPAHKEFSLPLSCKINLINSIGSQGLSGIIEKALSSEKKLPLNFEGHCRVVINGNAYKIPISFQETIVFK